MKTLVARGWSLGLMKFHAALFMVLGMLMAAPGLWLLYLGGSAYYLLAGMSLLAAGYFLWCRRMAGLWLYAGLLLATLVWSIVEVGFDGWTLISRLGLFLAMGMWLATPWAHRVLRQPGI